MWKCPKCGKDNPDALTRCQYLDCGGKRFDEITHKAEAIRESTAGEADTGASEASPGQFYDRSEEDIATAERLEHAAYWLRLAVLVVVAVRASAHQRTHKRKRV